MAGLAFSGCLDDSQGPEGAVDGPQGWVSAERIPDDGFDYANEWDWAHGADASGHAVAANHEHSHGLELVGYNPLTRIGEGSDPLGHDASFIALDTWSGDGAYYACVAHFQTGPGGGATIIDVTDPTQPTMLATVLSGMQNSDCQFTDDGRFLLVAAYSGVTPGVPGVPPPVGDLAAQGVLIYDVSDKANPRFLRHDTTAVDGNAYHNVFTAKIGETNYVFQTYTGNILSLDEETGALSLVGKLPIADHDIWIGRHPLTGMWIALTGAERAMTIYNVEDPANPTVLATWVPTDDKFTGWHRQWPVTEPVDGRALMLVAGEESASQPTWYTVLDFTEPDDVKELGHWTIPVPEGAATQHEFEQWDGYFATANYHSGLWLIDIGSLARALAPVTIGYYLPHEDPFAHGGVAPPAGASIPNVWGAAFDDRGLVYTADRTSGLYVLSFAATPPLR